MGSRACTNGYLYDLQDIKEPKEMLTETQTQRLKQLEEKEEDFTEDERKEWVELHEDQDNEAIEAITEEQKLQPLKDEKLRLEM